MIHRSIDRSLSLSHTHTRLLASFSPPVEDEGVDLGDGHLAQDRHFPLFPRELGLPSAAFVLDRVNRVEGLAGDHAETLVRPEGRHHSRAEPNGGRESPVPVKGRGRERRERRQSVRQSVRRWSWLTRSRKRGEVSFRPPRHSLRGVVVDSESAQGVFWDVGPQKVDDLWG